MELGLKLWSVNTDYYLKEAVKLYDQGVYDYIELYVVPETLDTLKEWKKLNIPFIMHNAHFMQGFNLARDDKKQRNMEIYNQTKQFADELKAKYIIFHGGIDGDYKETARQLASFEEPRALIENKPFIALPNRMGGNYCRGATVEELRYIKETTGCGFCLDFGHAVCSAASQKINPYEYIKEMMVLSPNMFHLTDNDDISSPYDSHLHLGTGVLDFEKIKQILPQNSIVSLETDKDSKENLNDFVADVQFMKRLVK